MAVMMVIGNQQEVAVSLFAPGSTLATKIANEFTEAVAAIYQHSLFEVGLVLLGVTMLVNVLARLLLKTFAGTAPRQP
jgi:phosphate transport system permease protein